MKESKGNAISYKSAVIFLFCAITAFFLLMICSRSSFLYPCNDWNDANSYFTMGKAMMNGQIIYRDLYDQKGPYLYLLYGLAYLMHHTSFAGVFVLEITAVAFFLFFCYKILRLYCSKAVSCFLLPVLGAAVLSSKSFYWGGAAEEFCLPLLSGSLYCTIKYYKEQYPKDPCLKMIFLNGISAGIIMQIKYNILGFHFAWMAMIAFSLLFRKEWKNFFKSCLLFLGGMLLTFIPWLVYFGINNALDDWYQCYVYNNVFLYSNLQQEEISLTSRIYDLAKLLYWLILDNLSYFFFIILGGVYFLLSRKIHWYEKINLLMLSGLLFLGIYVGGSNLPYYSIPLTIFTCLGTVAIGRALDKTAGKVLATHSLSRYCKIIMPTALLLSIGSSMAFSYGHSMNSYFMKQEQSSYFLYQFRDMIRQEEDPSLLNIGCLDAGLYTVADIMPTCKYFQTNGIAFDEMFQEQYRYIEEGRTQYILARDEYPEIINEKYELISSQPYEWSGMEFTYFLFRRRS
ncbi:MAG: hypothetical protein HDR71_17210 [Lachnospiraceae bacterium]|nr:hypothetical protein [Lachnospiraceae bacterium]MBD5395952.1 hypothetical protein [Lachnospiraceae bacterium]